MRLPAHLAQSLLFMLLLATLLPANHPHLRAAALDPLDPTIERLALPYSGNAGCELPGRQVISADGSKLLFYCGGSDLLVYDTATAQIQRIPHFWPDGFVVPPRSEYAALASEGRYVAFSTRRNDVVAGDSDIFADIFRYDLQASQGSSPVRRLSRASNGGSPDASSSLPSISADGQYVSFLSKASNLAPDPVDEDQAGGFSQEDIFVASASGTINLVSATVPVTGALVATFAPISADSQALLYLQQEQWYVGPTRLLVGTRNGGASELAADSATVRLLSSGMSDNGRFVVYSRLLPGPPSQYSLVLLDLKEDTSTVIPLTTTGSAFGVPVNLQVSDDGRQIAFASGLQLAASDTDTADDIYMYDTSSRALSRVSVDQDGSKLGYGGLFGLAADGCSIVFGTGLSYLKRLCGIPDPLIVIPGIAGSILSDGQSEYWPGICELQAPLSLYSSDNPNGQRRISATDVIRTVDSPNQLCSLFLSLVLPLSGEPEQVYDSLLTFLGRKGYREYDVAGLDLRRTRSGCDLSQRPRRANLFVFAYDWRLSNATNAARLADYMGCVQQFYPGRTVNILAHSMGGLIARRYILDYQQQAGGHHVGKLVTVGTPWLGAPKLSYVLATGDFVATTSDPVAQYVIGSFTGAHELLPSRTYFEVAEAEGAMLPFAELGLDMNGNDRDQEIYSYEQLRAMIDQQFGYDTLRNHEFFPGTASQRFHDYAAPGAPQNRQDDWRSDTSGVEYYHIYGIQKEPRTIGQVQASWAYDCGPKAQNLRSCATREQFTPRMTMGDGVVPTLSSSRPGRNAPGVQPIKVDQLGDDSSEVEHSGLCSNPLVQQRIIELLGSGAAPGALAVVEPAAEAAAQPVFVLSISGARQLVAGDEAGNRLNYDDGEVSGSGQVVGLDLLPAGAQSATLILSSERGYRVELQAGDKPLAISLTRSDGTTTSQSIRYNDLLLPAGSRAELRFTDDGPQALRRDADGNGSFETIIAPTVALSGAQAQDQTPPQISAQLLQQGSQFRVTLSGSDTGAGMGELLYSLDGETYRLYQQPLTIDPARTPRLVVLAEDRAGNRAATTISLASQRLYLPYLLR